MEARDRALKTILKRKMFAEQVADINLNKVLQNERIKILFVKCKRLVVEIAKLEVDGKDSSELKKEYNEGRELIAELLKTMGVDKSELKPKYNCSKCKDTGYIGIKECECLKQEISKELINISGIDINTLPRFSDDFSVFENPEKVKTLYDKMKKYIDDINNTIYDVVLIVGDTGVGKTYLMGCMTTYAIDKFLTIKYTTAFKFNQEMLKYHCSKLEEKDNYISPYLECDILFIDDLGSENKIKNVTNEYLYSIINERMQNHKKTVITTNLDFGQIQESYGERVFSRLMHKINSLKVNFTGSDLRIKK